MSTKAEQAIAFHDKGYNCAQAVACSFCKEFGVDEEEMFRIAEGFGLGMGMMEVCGALSGMMMIIGLQNSVGNPEKGKMMTELPMQEFRQSESMLQNLKSRTAHISVKN